MQACSYLPNNKSPQFLNQFKILQTKLTSLVLESKEKDYARLSKKLIDPETKSETRSKSYWSMLKTALN